jgi:hypothetical protein
LEEREVVVPKRKPAAVKPKPQAVEEVIGLVDAFCNEHLNREYADLCKELAGRLARKRPSPLLSGKPESWACGIVRTIGFVNFLDDSSQVPHMKLTAIDKAFGVSESTGQSRSRLIRKMFRIVPLHPEWTLPSMQDANPLAWMIPIDGFLVDARILKRDVQEELVRLGLIPYVPAHPNAVAIDDDDDEFNDDDPEAEM